MFNGYLNSIHELEFCIRNSLKEHWFSGCFQSNFPGYLPQDYPQKDLFIKYELVDNEGRARCRINILRGRIFITDGPWNLHKSGIFPWSDESELILDYIDSHSLSAKTQGIVDPACGCGHTPIAYAGEGPRFAFDINPRADKFVMINSTLNGVQVNYRHNDISVGFPLEFHQELCSKRLFAINMPHALSPLPNALPAASDGGLTGLEWTLTTLRSLRDFVGSGGIAVVLCYSLGDDGKSRWEIIEQAYKLFAPSNVSWELLPDIRIWRINGKKEQPNPMILSEGLPKKADCKLYVKDEQREKVRQGYLELASKFEKMAWYVLGCGILEVRL